jgi:hypothetical protein
MVLEWSMEGRVSVSTGSVIGRYVVLSSTVRYDRGGCDRLTTCYTTYLHIVSASNQGANVSI